MAYAGKSLKLARKQAQANANDFGIPFAVWEDALGNLQVSPLTTAPASTTVDYFYPQK